MFCKILTLSSGIILANVGVTKTLTLVGSTVELKCKYQANSSVLLNWLYISEVLIQVSSNDTIFLNSYPEIKRRVTITGNHMIGEYHLSISDVKKTDAGQYQCSVDENTEEHQLTVIEGPRSVGIASKTQNNTLIGTEDKDLNISCAAVGGYPAPDMVLQIRNEDYTSKSTQTIKHTLSKVDRSYDGSTVTCLAGYQSISYFPVSDTVTIYLYLKPSIPLLSFDPVVIVETNPLSVTCISTGGRAKPTDKWSIDNVDITTHSTELSTTHDIVTDTYTVTSSLTYSVNRNDNGKTLSCGFKNAATGNSYVSLSRKLDVKFSPSVSVDNATFNPSDLSRQISCAAFGNPTNYMFSYWRHKSKYGSLIRTLAMNSTLTLPTVSEENRYQDTGEYVCTVSNGIKDKDGLNNEKASGFVISNAPPVFLSGQNQTNLGQLKRDIKIQVNVYSEPIYSSLIWLKGSSPILSSSKYTMSDVQDVMTGTFYGREVQVDGHRLTLTIHSLEIEDFVNYTLRLSNGVTKAVEHFVKVMSASRPEIPTNFTVVDATESTVTLKWSPGFDGGHEQTFVVEYRTAGSSVWNKATVPKYEQIPKDDLLTYELPGLELGTLYEIKMYAGNKYNNSDATNVVIISTKESFGQGTIISAVVGVIAVLVIILTILSIIIIRKRRGNTAKKKSQNSKENSPVYDNVTESQAENTNAQTYEALGLKEKPSVYETLEERIRGNTTKKMSQNSKENSPVYDNVTDSQAENTNAQTYAALGLKDKPSVYEAYGQPTRDSQSKIYVNTMI